MLGGERARDGRHRPGGLAHAGRRAGRWRGSGGLGGRCAPAAVVVAVLVGRSLFEHKLVSGLGPSELKPLYADAAGRGAGPLAENSPHRLDLVGLLVAPEGGGGDEDGYGHDDGHDASQHAHGLHGVVFGLHQEGGHGASGQHLEERCIQPLLPGPRRTEQGP